MIVANHRRNIQNNQSGWLYMCILDNQRVATCGNSIIFISVASKEGGNLFHLQRLR